MEVKAWEESVTIPTYKIGAPDKNPMFLEKRVYQGSSGAVYPYPVIDKVTDEKEDKEWIGLFLENQYLKVLILPQLGGRIQMAYDKTNDYHFVYYNSVIKPALVGLLGPWISGGIEFNWPQHHRPTTFDATDFSIEEHDNGSKTVWVNEYEKMFGTKCALGFTLYTDKAYIEITAKMYNRTPFPQTFLWWANPAVSVDEHYQSVFPPDVTAVFDHGKRDVSEFPIAKGTYYKVDYSPGTDISVYTNIPVPTSYMAVNSAFDFMGGYNHKKRAGLMHVANHHISPGKKQWTWGSGEFGKAWDRQLTDNDGPYFELMCGMFTDNQPDFSWLMPNEVREFRQYFMPYKNIGYVKNASIDAMVNLELNDSGVIIQVYLTSKRVVKIQLLLADKVLFERETELSPFATFSKLVHIGNRFSEYDLKLLVKDENNISIVSYSPIFKNEGAVPDPAKPIGKPQSLKTIEELYLSGLHLEQYRHATYDAIDYYKEALHRDDSDIRCNNAMGLWFLRRGEFTIAEEYFRKSVTKLQKHNPNPFDGEPLFNLGLCLKYQGKISEAENWLFKSTWNASMQDNAYLHLGYLEASGNNWQRALEFSNKSCLKNFHGLKNRHLKSLALRKLNKIQECITFINETLSFDLFDFASLFERILCYKVLGKDDEVKKLEEKLKDLMRNNEHNFIETSLQYYSAGCYEEALEVLSLIEGNVPPLVFYYNAFYNGKLNRNLEVFKNLEIAAGIADAIVFPNRIEDEVVLKFAVEKNEFDFRAFYYLGNFYYGKRLYEKAKAVWEKSAELTSDFATVYRNLAIAYYNKFNRKYAALEMLEKAFHIDRSDARVLFEMDQLKKRLNKTPYERLAFLEEYLKLVEERDDLYVEFVTLYSLTGNSNKAAQLLERRSFHPWEGGEGKVTSQYTLIKIEAGLAALKVENYKAALDSFEAALCYPKNLGEGKLFGAQENDIYYWLGLTHMFLGNEEQSLAYWEKACVGMEEPVDAVFYNDQQPDKIFYQGLALLKLKRNEEAEGLFKKLIAYGKKHMYDEVEIDFFAVSLPHLMIFDDDLNSRNRAHCKYLMGLGYLGLKDYGNAKVQFSAVLDLDSAHIGATFHSRLMDSLFNILFV